MRVGFTGTREGMTTIQWETFEYLVSMVGATEWHDGDCVGADTQAHATMRRQVFPAVRFVGWPCNLEKYRAHNEYDETHKVQAPLVRNRCIVRRAEIMFAAPKEFDEVFRGSGTWATIRYAKEQGTKLIIIYPDGSEERFNGA